MKIFLGGTCTNTTWRDELIPYLEKFNVEYFNPVVKNWTPECQEIEEDEKNHKCNIHLYVITKEMQGTYSIAEIINSAWQSVLYGTNVNFIVFAVLNEDKGEWTNQQIKSFDAIMKMVENIAPFNSICYYVKNMEELSEYLKIIRIFENSQTI